MESSTFETIEKAIPLIRKHCSRRGLKISFLRAGGQALCHRDNPARLAATQVIYSFFLLVS
jgi:hypothetical protein